MLVNRRIKKNSQMFVAPSRRGTDTPVVVVCTGEAVQCSVIRNLGPGDLFQSASAWHKHSHQTHLFISSLDKGGGQAGG